MTATAQVSAAEARPGNGLWLAATILGGWFLVVLAAVLGGVTELRQSALPWPPVVFILGPIAIYYAARGLFPGFRDWLGALDLRFLAAMQAWRVLGGMFVVLLLWDALPPLFAWPAGLGDAAIGLIAPFMVLALLRDPGFATSRGFVWWNVLGLADFVVAVSLGILAAGAIAAVPAGPVSSAPMGQFPLAIIPFYLVPIFALMHLTTLHRVAELRRGASR